MKERLIVADSCCDLTEELKNKLDIELVPLTLQLDDVDYLDDENLNVNEYIENMKKASSVKTAAPSPKLFMDKFEQAKEVFCITLSGKLSATYSNACLARTMVLEKGEKLIHIFDTKSAAASETLVALKIQECIDKKMTFQEIVDNVTKYISEMNIFFVLESLDNLIKNGRISKLKAMIASAFSIKPVMYGVDGEIEVYKKVRGLKKAYAELIGSISENCSNMEDKKLVITHCNCLERAKEIRNKIIEKYNFKEILIVPARGLSSTYENEGGIIISY
ncbi:DegV family protein [uncultured Parvimonas sp.]|uniref:DegV family protein n=1 Tax=uncultured Parvimonas sp. TaxID=747372 RepID=UPI0028894329|nr:DegV family protein [uncultured Parvimonas sp.]